MQELDFHYENNLMNVEDIRMEQLGISVRNFIIFIF